MNPLTISFSLSDQRFESAKSLGILNTSVGLARAMAERKDVTRLTLFTNPSLPQIGDSRSNRVVPLQFKGFGPAKLWRLWWDQIGVYRAAHRARNEWLLLPKGYASFLKRCPVKMATYVHDVTQEYYRERYPTGFPRFENTYFRAGFRAAIAHSQIVLVNSKFSASEIRRVAENQGLRAPPIEVAGIGFEPVAPSSNPVERTRIVVLASNWPHKRTDLALRFLSRWQAEHQFSDCMDWVGRLPEGLTFPVTKNWKLHNRLAPDSYERLVSEARALVYFSEYEGFGMPPVESALRGACPVFSDLPPTREVMGDAGCRFDNDSYESFAAALDSALQTPLDLVEQWARKLVQRHNWPGVAERIVRALASTSNLPK